MGFVCAPPPSTSSIFAPPPPITEHVSLHSKSLSKKYVKYGACILGLQISYSL